jgi:MFS family permease
MLSELKTGYRYVMTSPPIRTSLILLAIVSAMGMPYTVLMPAIVSDVLHGGPRTLGVLMTASGVGALAGALYLASRETIVGLGRVSAISTVSFGLGLVAFAFTPNELLAVLILPVVGAGLMMQMGATNTILQTIVEDRLRGRVMAFYTMAFFGSAPIGSLVAGVAADRIGAQWTIAVCGMACVLTGIWFARRLPALRTLVSPIYIARGILPVPAVDSGTKTL